MFVDLVIQLERHPHVEDPLGLGVEHVARQAVLGDPESHHPAHHRAGLVDRHVVAEAAQVVRRGETRGPGADDEHPLARGLARDVDGPALSDCLVAEEALDRVDPHGLVELRAVAGGLAGVVADPPHDRRERVVLHQLAPRPLIAAFA